MDKANLWPVFVLIISYNIISYRIPRSREGSQMDTKADEQRIQCSTLSSVNYELAQPQAAGDMHEGTEQVELLLYAAFLSHCIIFRRRAFLAAPKRVSELGDRLLHEEKSCVTYGWSWRRSSALPAQDADHCRPKLDKLKKRLSLTRPHARFQFEAAASKVWMPAAKHLQVQSHRALPTLDPKSKGFGSASANSASRQAIIATEPEMLPRNIFVKSSENLTSPEENASVCRLLPPLPDEGLPTSPTPNSAGHRSLLCPGEGP